MGIASNVQRRGAVYYVRVRVPLDLRGRLDKGEIVISLRTTSPTEGRRRGARATQAALELFERLRRGVMIDRTEIEAQVRAFYDHQLEEDRLGRLVYGAPETGDFLARQIAGRGAELAAVREDLALGRIDRFAGWARTVLLAAGHLPQDVGAMTFAETCQLVGRAMLEALRRAEERDRGDFAGVARDPLIAATPGLAPPPRATDSGATIAVDDRERLPLADHVDRFLNEKKDLTEKSRRDYRRSLAAFGEVVGPKPLVEITGVDAVKFKDALLMLPVNATQRLKTDSILKAIELNKKAGLPTIDAKTANEKYLSNAKSFFTWAERNKLARENPVSGVSILISKRKKASQERDPFSDEQLRRFFEQPLFAGCRSAGRRLDAGAVVIRDHYFWLPLLMLFGGGRPSEWGQMRPNDVVDTDLGPHFSINTMLEPGEEIEERRLKSPAACRRIPIHPQLIEIGFLDYATGLKGSGSERLFPNWRIGADGYYSSPVSKWFARFLGRAGLKTAKTSLYSLRHNFKDGLRSARLDPVAQDLVMGHANDSVQARYGSGALQAHEVGAFCRIRFPTVNVGALVGRP